MFGQLSIDDSCRAPLFGPADSPCLMPGAAGPRFDRHHLKP